MRPNETVSVGDIVFDLRNEAMLTWTEDRDDRTAAAAMTTGERLAPGMVVRPLRRIDGGALLPSDHARFVPLKTS